MADTYDISVIVKTYISHFNEHQGETIAKLQKQYPSAAKTIKFDFSRQLDKNYTEFVNNKIDQELAVRKFEESYFKGTIRSKAMAIMLIANDFTLNKGHLESFLERHMYTEMHVNADNEKISNDVINIILQNLGNTPGKTKYLKSLLDRSAERFLPFILNSGFQNNVVNLENGVSSSNQGDGGEHIFVAKAIIAGFNASIVEIRTSAYDAVIEDKSSNLLKVQVKSFTGPSFSRKGRDRGGQGVDSTDISNKGKLVTSQNCDVFVAVNKQNGELFIFKGEEIDKLPETTMKRADYLNNWENWAKINE